MQKLLLLAIFASLNSYAGISMFKVDSDGMYRFKSQPFMVWAPKECMLDMAVRDVFFVWSSRSGFLPSLDDDPRLNAQI